MEETLRKEEVLRRFKTNRKTGLTENEAYLRKQKYGKNKLNSIRKKSILINLIEQLEHFDVIMLIISLFLSFIISYIQNNNNYINNIIFSLIIITYIIGKVIQNYVEENRVEEIQDMIPYKARVIRNNIAKEINAENLVPGDLVELEAGCYVPADCRLIETYNLKVEEFNITKEKEAVSKNANLICKKDTNINNMFNMAFMGTIVVSGHAKAIVCRTGNNTNAGKIINLITKNKKLKYNCNLRKNKIEKIIGMSSIIICLIAFIIGIVKNMEFKEILRLISEIIIACIPESIPFIITAIILYEVSKMKKNNSIINKKSVIKKINSGTVLCVNNDKMLIEKPEIKKCKKAGIKILILTNNNSKEIDNLARTIGVLEREEQIISGKELNKMSQTALEREILKYTVFEKATIEDKIRIVKALQSIGEKVIVTGENIEDRLLLKIADIGISMGSNLAQITMNVSDIIITNNKFKTIMELLEEGKNICRNFKEIVYLLIVSGMGEIITIFSGIILNNNEILMQMQLLWINCIFIPTISIPIAFKKNKNSIMKEKPIDLRRQSLFKGVTNKLFIEGIMMAMTTILAFSIGKRYYNIETGKTMAFITIELLGIIYSYIIVSKQLGIRIFKYKIFVVSFILCIMFQIILFVIPKLRELFGIVPLTYIQYIITIVLSMIPIIILKIQIKVNEFKYGKVISVADYT